MKVALGGGDVHPGKCVNKRLRKEKETRGRLFGKALFKKKRDGRGRRRL